MQEGYQRKSWEITPAGGGGGGGKTEQREMLNFDGVAIIASISPTGAL